MRSIVLGESYNPPYNADIPAPLKRGQYLGYNVAYINGEMVRADGNAGYGEVHTSYVHTTTIEQLAAL